MEVSACSPSADSLFGPTVRGCRGDFDFTLTFEQAIFSILPCALVLTVAPLRLRILAHRGPKVHGTALKFAKTCSLSLLAALQLSITILWASQPSQRAWRISCAASAVAFITSLVLCTLSFLEHSRSLRPSILLSGYLFFSILLDAAILRTIWLLQTLPHSIPGLYTTIFAIKCVVLLLEAKEKTGFFATGHEPRTPEDSSGLFSQSLFLWLNRLILHGARKVLVPTDLYELSDDMTAHTLSSKFRKAWSRLRSSTTSSKLMWTIISVAKVPLFLAAMPRLATLALTFCQPLLLRRLLSHIQQDVAVRDKNIGYGLVGAYGVVYSGLAVTGALYWYRHARLTTMVRGLLITAVYEKALEARSVVSERGKTVTLMSTDVAQIVRALYDIHELWASIIQIGIAAWLIYTQIGVAFVGPITVSLAALGTTAFIARYTARYQLKWIMKVQERLGFTNSLLGSMKGIKMSGLQARVSAALAQSRTDELNAAGKFRLINAVTVAVANAPILLSPVVTFAVYAGVNFRENSSVDLTKVFTSLSLVLLMAEPLFGLMQGITDMMSALGCLRRIETFLLETPVHCEKKPVTQYDTGVVRSIRRPRSADAADMIVNIKGASYGWSEGEAPTIRSIDLVLMREQLLVIHGPIGCGKSTLLQGILGETTLSTGLTKILARSVAWCGQTPWLLNGTVQENIIGSSVLDRHFYASVIHACDLADDLQSLPHGDETQIGSRGLSLSGGQRQRVALARAVYTRPDLLLLDDVFSNLDHGTQRVVFQRLLGTNGLLRRLHTAVMLATHSLAMSVDADKTLTISAQGDVTERTRKDDAVFTEKLTPTEEFLTTARQRPGPSAKPDELVRPGVKNESQSLSRQTGDLSVYAFYAKLLSWRTILVFVALQVAYAALSTYPYVWLKEWTDANRRSGSQSNAYYIGIYAAMQIGALLTSSLVTFWCFNVMAVDTGTKLHMVLAQTVLRAPLSFFGTVDSGSILNRFSQDVQLLDIQLPLSVQVCVSTALICLGQMGLIASASGWIAISYPFLLAIFYAVLKYYLRTSRQLRHLDLEQKAPLFSHFTQSLEGLITIRTHRWQHHFTERNNELTDLSQRPFYLMYSIQRWLGLVLDLIIAALAVLIVALAINTPTSSSVGFTGVSLTQIITFTSSLKLLIMFWAQMETSIGAVSRIKQFKQQVVPEDIINEPSRVAYDWPAQGEIIVSNMSAKYRHTQHHNSLDDLSIHIRPGQKVAFCGRTGSGKSSALLTLLHLLDTTSGHITIDGINVIDINRELLRTRLNVVAEELFMLPGSVRNNLHLFGQATDEELRDVLVKCHLWELVNGKGGLDVNMLDLSLSQGQRQLFNVARALLRRDSNVLILDEATSSLDADTEEKVVELIRTEFVNHTVIAVAHRLDTILDFDLVCILDHGRLVESGQPSALLQQTSRFAQLYRSQSEE